MRNYALKRCSMKLNANNVDNINGRDVQRKNVVNNVDKSSLVQV